MHELGVVFHIIDELKVVAEDNNVTRFSKVVLELGEVSSVIPILRIAGNGHLQNMNLFQMRSS